MKNSPFFKQADLLVQIIPFVSAETCFAGEELLPLAIWTF
jgi:hypothetical protein